MSNPYKKLREIIPEEPLGVGTVMAIKSDGVIVDILGGGDNQDPGKRHSGRCGLFP